MKVDCAHDELVELCNLQPHPKNPNKHPAKQINLLAKIIAYQGQRSPIVVSRRSGYIVKGHGRLDALKKLGWSKAAVDYQDYDSEAQEYADLNADNKIAELAKYDDKLMLAAIGDLNLPDDFDLDLFGVPDLKLPDPDADALAEVIPEEVTPYVKRGQVWSLGDHRLVCGDSTSAADVELLMKGEKPDMVFTDPPYGVDYEQGKFTGSGPKQKFKKIANDELKDADLSSFVTKALKTVSYDTCVFYVWSAPLLPGAAMLRGVLDAGIHVQSQIVWNKERLILGRADYHWQHEICWYGYVGKNHHWCGDRTQTTVWNLKRDSDYVHPTQKPVGLAERACLNSTMRGGKVLDLFGGSGSTLMACEKTSRQCFIMELDEHYCDVIIARWEQFTGKKAMLLNGWSQDNLRKHAK